MLLNINGAVCPPRPAFEPSKHIGGTLTAILDIRDFHTPEIRKNRPAFMSDLADMFVEPFISEQVLYTKMVDKGWAAGEALMADICIAMYMYRLGYIEPLECWMKKYAPMAPFVTGDVIQGGIILYSDTMYPGYFILAPHYESSERIRIAWEDAKPLTEDVILNRLS